MLSHQASPSGFSFSWSPKIDGTDGFGPHVKEDNITKRIGSDGEKSRRDAFVVGVNHVGKK